jgi:hypothetical protein
MLKIAVLAPVPMASVTIAAVAKSWSFDPAT